MNTYQHKDCKGTGRILDPRFLVTLPGDFARLRTFWSEHGKDFDEVFSVHASHLKDKRHGFVLGYEYRELSEPEFGDVLACMRVALRDCPCAQNYLHWKEGECPTANLAVPFESPTGQRVCAIVESTIAPDVVTVVRAEAVDSIRRKDFRLLSSAYAHGLKIGAFSGEEKSKISTLIDSFRD